MIYIRKKPKGFGNDQQIEGKYQKGERAILIEDLATDGGSKIIFIEAMRKCGLKVSDVFVIFYYDIFNINSTLFESMDLKLHSLCTWKNIIEVINEKKLLNENEVQNLNIFLKNPDAWRERNG